ncbi:MAG: glucose 1-dehydrogenase [Deltaproteobacteria bacterium]|nr:glucose 1-dehydrogenase [Deltaproteobacteria bacterium]
MHSPNQPSTHNPAVQGPFDLDGKVALITGASKGIGRAIAVMMSQQGAKVVVSSRKQEAVDQVAKEIIALGGDAVGIAAHMGNADDIDNLVTKTIEAFGALDIVVNNAATNPIFGPLLDVDAAVFDKILDVNVKGPMLLCQKAQPFLVERGGGSVINISSIGGISPEPLLGVYSVSKSAIISLTQVMAKEWGGLNIRANAVCPGLIRTKFSSAIWSNEALLEDTVKDQPLPRMAEPEEVAGLVTFLASPSAGFCTGGVYTVDGGHTV